MLFNTLLILTRAPLYRVMGRSMIVWSRSSHLAYKIREGCVAFDCTVADRFCHSVWRRTGNRFNFSLSGPGQGPICHCLVFLKSCYLCSSDLRSGSARGQCAARSTIGYTAYSIAFHHFPLAIKRVWAPHWGSFYFAFCELHPLKKNHRSYGRDLGAPAAAPSRV